MGATAKLGTTDSRPSNIVLGGGDPSPGTEYDKTVEDILSFSQSVDVHGDLEISAANTISLVDSASFIGDFNISVSNTISLTDSTRINQLPIHVSHALSLLDTVTQQLRIEHVADDLSLSQTVAVSGNRSASASNSLPMTDTVDIHFGVANQSIEDVLDGDGTTTTLLRDTVNLTWDLSLQSTLSLTDAAARIIAVHDTISLSQSVSTSEGAFAEDAVLVEDTVFVQAIYRRLVVDDIGVEDTVTYFIDETGKECQYNPFLGAGSPVSPTPPTLGHATLTLTFPYVSPTTTLVLRNPDFGNQETLSFDRIVRTTRGGDLEVFADPDWAKTQTLKLTVTDLTAQQAEDFLDFLGDSLGLEIGLLDWENRQWRGLITTPDAEVTNHGTCKREITFEFEGELA